MNYNRRANTRDTPGAPDSSDQGDCLTGTYRTPTAKGHSAKTRTQQQLYLIHRNKQGSSENEETKKYFPNERPEQNSGKRTKQMETSNLPDAQF